MTPPGGADQDTLWWARGHTPPAAPPLLGAARADVAIVGAGILGLSMALHLAVAGARVVVIEAGQPGGGASGRNTGFVVPSLTAGHGPASVARLLGAEAGDRLARLVGGSAEAVFATIRRFGIACDAEQTGWLQPAHTPDRMRLLEARVREWRALDQPVELLDRAETARLTGSRRYFGALLDRSGGQIDPLAYARGLAAAAVARGAVLHGDSPARGHARDGAGWRVDTPRGHIVASTVCFTTNALAGALLPSVHRALIAVTPYQVATQPLDAATLARILPERHPVSDLHRHSFAYRLSADNRLVTGGIAVRNDAAATARMAAYFLRRLRRYLPDLPPLRADHAWRGLIATTRDFLPALWEIEPGVFAPIGCNGRGVAMTTALGRALAGHLVDPVAHPSPLPLTTPRARALHALSHLAPSAWLAWNRWHDGRDDRAAAAALVN
jgi:glycine/D-amino acid oxidase-like deaminating enzyme